MCGVIEEVETQMVSIPHSLEALVLSVLELLEPDHKDLLVQLEHLQIHTRLLAGLHSHRISSETEIDLVLHPDSDRTPTPHTEHRRRRTYSVYGRIHQLSTSKHNILL